MRPKICVPIVAVTRDSICQQASLIGRLPVQMAEWRIDYYAGYAKEILGIVAELKTLLRDKELIVTLRTEAEGGEPNGSRFDYKRVLTEIVRQGLADYVDVELDRDMSQTEYLCRLAERSQTKVIGSYHDFYRTPTRAEIVSRLSLARQCRCDMGKVACMPQEPSDVDRLLEATAQMKDEYPDFPIITMSMGEMGVASRLYGGLYGSEVSFGQMGAASAPGQVPYQQMNQVFDKIYKGNRHIILIGFMGVGKSTISRELAYQTSRAEIDTDRWIEEHEGKKISQIFEEDGEEHFRDLETDMIDELADMKPAIISCGGGMAMRGLNVRKLKAMGHIVLLTAKPETIYERVRMNDDRPVLRGHMNTEYISQLMEQRRPYYEAAADVSVPTDHRMISDVAKEILEVIN